MYGYHLHRDDLRTVFGGTKMKDKTLKHMSGQAAKVQRQQGGANLDQGPNGASSPKKSGDAVTNPTFYTKQDQSCEQGGPPKNKFHDV